MPSRSLARALAALAVAAAGAAAGTACGAPDAAHPARGVAASADTAAFRPLAVGDAAPAYAARTLAGDSVRVGEGSGAPPTLLNVWATWCTSCREEMGDLAALHREFAPRGLRVLAVSVDNGDVSRVQRFAERERLPFAVAHDPEGTVQERFRVVGVPESYLIGRDGRVVWRHAGNVHAVLDSARAEVSRALAR